jgi:hypothetical protein
MKKSLKKSFITFFVFLFVGIVGASAQKSQWTYAMKQDGVTYKIHFQQERGTLTIQIYDSNSNKWNWGTILEQKPSSGDGGYYKVKAGNGYTYHIWTYSSSSSLVVKVDGSQGQWTYYLESSK